MARNRHIARAAENDPPAIRHTAHETPARSLAGVINVLDPEVIVLGGGLSNIARIYANVSRLCKEFVFSDDLRTRIVPPAHGDSSGVRGAAWLWDPNYLER